MQPTPKDIQDALMNPDGIQHPPKTKGRGHWKDRDRVNKVRSDSHWDVRLAEVASRLIAAGFTYDDIGTVLGVSGNTVLDWTKKYSSFKDAAEAGHAAANALTLGQLLRAAWGYEYQEVTIKKHVKLDSEGNEIPSDDETDAIITIHKKHQPGNADLLKFIAVNKLPDEFKNRTEIDIKQVNLTLTGSAEIAEIDRLVGRLVKQIDVKEISSENVGGV